MFGFLRFCVRCLFMVSKNRRLVSGLLSALLVSGSASAGFVGSAAGAAKSALALPLNVAGKVVGTAVGVATLIGGGYILYLSYNHLTHFYFH